MHRTHVCRQCGTKIDADDRANLLKRIDQIQKTYEVAVALGQDSERKAEQARSDSARFRGIVVRLIDALTTSNKFALLYASGLEEDQDQEEFEDAWDAVENGDRVIAESSNALNEKKPPMSEGEKYFEDKQPYPDEP